MTGQVWNVPGYEAFELLGEGGRGPVWLARGGPDGPVVLRYLTRPAQFSVSAGTGPSGADSWLAQLRQAAALTAADPGGHLVAIRRVVAVPSDVTDGPAPGSGAVLVMDLAPRRDLGRLLRRRQLEPGELVTVAAPLAATLAVIHEQGWCLGTLSAGDILFDGNGRPVLDSSALTPIPGGSRGSGTAPGGLSALAFSADADVRSLAAVCRLALGPERGGGPAGPAREALEAAVDAALDPRATVSARQFAAAVRASGPAAPVRFGAPERAADIPQRRSGRSATRAASAAAPSRFSGRTKVIGAHRSPDTARRSWPVGGCPATALHALDREGRRLPRGWISRAATTVVAALAMGSAVAIGASGAASDGGGKPATLRELGAPAGSASAVPPLPADSSRRPPPGTGPDDGSAQQRWRHVLVELDGRRGRAYATSDAAALAAVYVPGSPALAADLARLRELQRRGARATDLALRISDVSVLRERPDAVELTVVDTLDGYRLRFADGVVRTAAGRGAASWTVRLLRTSAGWRIHSVASTPPADDTREPAASR